jgi:1-acyl-sn-glycerol-3-phosphate acyltransferase
VWFPSVMPASERPPTTREAPVADGDPRPAARGELVPVATPPPGPTGDEARQGDVDGWGRSERARTIARAVYDPIYKHWFRAEWDGLEHIPRHGGALLVANHAGAIPPDAPLIMHGIERELGRPVYGMADFLFRSMPVAGTLWARLGGVTAHPDNAYRLLHDEKQLALVFPEGTKATGKLFRERYQLRRFGRGGFVETAMRAGVPVVPIAVVGAEEAMPTLFKVPPLAKLLGVPYVPVTANMLLFGPAGLFAYFPAKFKLRVLPAIHFDVPPDQERYPRSRIVEVADGIRQSIQDALYDMLRQRRSVVRG